MFYVDKCLNVISVWVSASGRCQCGWVVGVSVMCHVVGKVSSDVLL